MSTQQTAAAADLFTAAFGYDPAGVWAAPGRVNVIGEHTDYNAGFVLPMAIDRYTQVAAAPRTDGRLRLVSSAADRGAAEIAVDALAPGRPATAADGPAGAADTSWGDTSWTAYPAGVAWAMLDAGALPSGPAGFRGADLAFSSTVPVGAGLSSSAALECATVLALAGLAGPDRPAPADLARLAQRAENDYVGVPCGPLDQLASSFGADGSVLFIDTRSLAIAPFPFDLAAAGLTLLVCDTRAQHDLGDSGYPARRATCEKAAAVLGLGSLRELGESERAATRSGDAGTSEDVLAERALDAARDRLDELSFRRVRHVVTENARVRSFVGLLTAGPLGGTGAGGARAVAAGELMTASHRSLRDDFEVSCVELDLVVEAALRGGAYGARMTGGGFGGSAIALVPLDRMDRVVEAVRAALPQTEFFPAVAARGAHRVR
jgi:galactokinase